MMWSDRTPRSNFQDQGAGVLEKTVTRRRLECTPVTEQGGGWPLGAVCPHSVLPPVVVGEPQVLPED